MKYLKYVVLFLIVLKGALLANGQIMVGPVISPPIYNEPVCVWGYYSYYPYNCVPYGYYSSPWFINGIFIGAGPWYGYHWRGYGYGWYRTRGSWSDQYWNNEHSFGNRIMPFSRGFGGRRH